MDVLDSSKLSTARLGSRRLCFNTAIYNRGVSPPTLSSLSESKLAAMHTPSWQPNISDVTGLGMIDGFLWDYHLRSHSLLRILGWLLLCQLANVSYKNTFSQPSSFHVVGHLANRREKSKDWKWRNEIRKTSFYITVIDPIVPIWCQSSFLLPNLCVTALTYVVTACI